MNEDTLMQQVLDVILQIQKDQVESFDKVYRRFDEVDKRFDRIEERLDLVEEGQIIFNQRLTSLEISVNEKLTAINKKITNLSAKVDNIRDEITLANYTFERYKQSHNQTDGFLINLLNRIKTIEQKLKDNDIE